jgi:hypothetical protein
MEKKNNITSKDLRDKIEAKKALLDKDVLKEKK